MSAAAEDVVTPSVTLYDIVSVVPVAGARYFIDSESEDKTVVPFPELVSR